MRDEENESEEGAVEDNYGFGEIGGFNEIGKRKELRCREKRTNSNVERKDEIKERERVGVNKQIIKKFGTAVYTVLNF